MSVCSTLARVEHICAQPWAGLSTSGHSAVTCGGSVHAGRRVDSQRALFGAPMSANRAQTCGVHSMTTDDFTCIWHRSHTLST
eukprot:8204185-Pyramimonas_sp.AAC.1